MATSTEEPSCWVLTGVMAAGKSTVADLLARRFARGVHVRGDLFRKMIVTGRDPIAPELGPEALRQLELRRRLAASTANDYWSDGFTVVLQDIYAGRTLVDVVDLIVASPCYVVVLNPSASVVTEREQHREKTGYVEWSVDDLWASFQRETPPVGLWLDTSTMTAEETVEVILDHRADARVK